MNIGDTSVWEMAMVKVLFALDIHLFPLEFYVRWHWQYRNALVHTVIVHGNQTDLPPPQCVLAWRIWVGLMTSLPVPLSQSVVPDLSPAVCSSAALSLGPGVSQSAAWLPCLKQAGDSGKICKVRDFTDPLQLLLREDYLFMLIGC